MLFFILLIDNATDQNWMDSFQEKVVEIKNKIKKQQIEFNHHMSMTIFMSLGGG